MIRLHVAFIDGSAVDEEFPNHELDEVEEMAMDLTEEFIIQVELEDNKHTIIYTYKRKTTYVY